MKKHLKAPSRCSWPPERFCFCALMYEDTCQKKKSEEGEEIGQLESREKQNKRGNKSKASRSLGWPCE